MSLSRRSLLNALPAPFLAPRLVAAPKKKPLVALELFSVRDELKKDLMGTVRAIAKLGYQGVEFFSPYFAWTPEQTKEVRKLLDDLGIVCTSTHNSASSFAPENLGKAIELNQILGSKFVVMASAGKVEGLDGWKGVADRLSAAQEKLKPAGMSAGFHNHKTEFIAISGTWPMEVLAKNTPNDVVLQLDIGTCLDAGVDPVAWIEKNPGRVRSLHLKEWSSDPAKGYKVIFGEGSAPWKKIFAAAEKTGGTEHYLIEQEGSATPPMETVDLCLKAFRKIHS